VAVTGSTETEGVGVASVPSVADGVAVGEASVIVPDGLAVAVGDGLVEEGVGLGGVPVGVAVVGPGTAVVGGGTAVVGWPVVGTAVVGWLEGVSVAAVAVPVAVGVTPPVPVAVALGDEVVVAVGKQPWPWMGSTATVESVLVSGTVSPIASTRKAERARPGAVGHERDARQLAVAAGCRLFARLGDRAEQQIAVVDYRREHRDVAARARQEGADSGVMKLQDGRVEPELELESRRRRGIPDLDRQLELVAQQEDADVRREEARVGRRLGGGCPALGRRPRHGREARREHDRGEGRGSDVTHRRSVTIRSGSWQSGCAVD
jgi:hypothetical protein